jgi:DNA segregation ATPase FtsK/SpoIIIE, S-DNA-T family
LAPHTATNNLVGNLDNCFNLLVGGKKGPGKSTFLHCAMVNLLRNTDPDKFKFILVDMGNKDLGVYRNLPNLLFPVVTKPDKVKSVLNWCVYELSRRFSLILEPEKKNAKKNMKVPKDEMPRILIVINESSGLMKTNPRYYKKALFDIGKYGIMGNMNLLISTSKISRDLYPKKFINQFNRVALATNSKEESRLLIGEEGAEKLRGKGEAIVKYPDNERATRQMQCFFISKKEVKQFLSSFK